MSVHSSVSSSTASVFCTVSGPCETRVEKLFLEAVPLSQQPSSLRASNPSGRSSSLQPRGVLFLLHNTLYVVLSGKPPLKEALLSQRHSSPQASVPRQTPRSAAVAGSVCDGHDSVDGDAAAFGSS